MKKLQQKLRARAGMTLTELLAAIAIMGLLGVAIGAGTSAAVRVYRASTTLSEAQVLQSTLAAAVADELRYATEIETGDGKNPSYYSAVYGKGVTLGADADGRLAVQSGSGTTEKSDPLVGAKTYSGGLTAEVNYSYTDGAFHVELTVRNGEEYQTAAEFDIAPINA